MAAFYFLSDVHLLKEINKEPSDRFSHVSAQTEEEKRTVRLYVRQRFFLLWDFITHHNEDGNFTVTFGNRSVPVWISFQTTAIVSERQAHTMSPHQLEH